MLKPGDILYFSEFQFDGQCSNWMTNFINEMLVVVNVEDNQIFGMLLKDIWPYRKTTTLSWSFGLFGSGNLRLLKIKNCPKYLKQ